MRNMCGADAGCLAIIYQSLCRHLLKNILNTANALLTGGELMTQLRTTLLDHLPLVQKITSGLSSDDASVKGALTPLTLHPTP